MRIGLLADIHGEVDKLQLAIDRLTCEGVDKFVVLGDLIYDRKNADETVQLLKACQALGVWGNHELALCVDPDAGIRDMYSDDVLEFFAGLDSQLQMGELLFSHTLPDQDASDPTAYYLGGRPDDAEVVDANFARFPHRVMLIGHFHCWFAATQDGRIAWDGDEPLKLDASKRYLFIIHAVMNGWAAIFDDAMNVLTPLRL